MPSGQCRVIGTALRSLSQGRGTLVLSRPRGCHAVRSGSSPHKTRTGQRASHPESLSARGWYKCARAELCEGGKETFLGGGEPRLRTTPMKVRSEASLRRRRRLLIGVRRRGAINIRHDAAPRLRFFEKDIRFPVTSLRPVLKPRHVMTYRHPLH